MRSLQPTAPLSPHQDWNENQRKPHNQSKTNPIESQKLKGNPGDHILVGSFPHNRAEIMNLGRTAGIPRDREDSKGKKNQNDEGEHNEQGKDESRGRRGLPSRETRLPVLRHGNKNPLKQDLELQRLVWMRVSIVVWSSTPKSKASLSLSLSGKLEELWHRN